MSVENAMAILMGNAPAPAAVGSDSDTDTVFQALIGRESGGNPQAVGYKEGRPVAFGIAQMRPATFNEVARELGETPDPAKIWDPDTNIRYARHYFEKNKAAYPDVPDPIATRLALVAYHSGPSGADQVYEQYRETGRFEVPRTQRYWDGRTYTGDYVEQIMSKAGRGSAVPVAPPKPVLGVDALVRLWTEKTAAAAKAEAAPAPPPQPAPPPPSALPDVLAGSERLNRFRQVQQELTPTPGPTAPGTAPAAPTTPTVPTTPPPVEYAAAIPGPVPMEPAMSAEELQREAAVMAPGQREKPLRAEKIAAALKSGAGQLLGGMARTPYFVNETVWVANNALNAGINQIIGKDVLRTDITSPDILKQNLATEFADDLVKKNDVLRAEFGDKDLVDVIGSGDIKGTAKYIALGTLEQVPLYVYLALSRAGALKAGIEAGAKLEAITLGPMLPTTASQKLAEYDQRVAEGKPVPPRVTQLMNAWTQGTAEVGFERMGSYRILERLGDAVKALSLRMAPKVAAKVVGNGFAQAAKGFLWGYKQEAKEEIGTQFAQDISDYFGGLQPDLTWEQMCRRAFEAGAIAGPLGGAAGGAAGVAEHTAARQDQFDRELAQEMQRASEKFALERQQEAVRRETEAQGLQEPAQPQPSPGAAGEATPPLQTIPPPW